jgi:hypothetical protein
MGEGGMWACGHVGKRACGKAGMWECGECGGCGNVELCGGEMGASGVSDVGDCWAIPDRCWGGVGMTRAT